MTRWNKISDKLTDLTFLLALVGVGLGGIALFVDIILKWLI